MIQKAKQYYRMMDATFEAVSWLAFFVFIVYPAIKIADLLRWASGRST